MKPKIHSISLARRSLQQLTAIAVVLLIGFILLMSNFFFFQFEEADNNQVRFQAVLFAKAIKQDPNYSLPRHKELSVYKEWDDIPKNIQKHFSPHFKSIDSPYPEHEEVMDLEVHNEQGELEYAYLYYLNNETLGNIYVLGFENAANFDEFTTIIFEQALSDAIILSVVLFFALFIILAWIFQYSQFPIKQLIKWSEELKNNPDTAATKNNFSINELNEIADYLLANLEQVKDHNQREQHFLKHASHEMRTPLAIIQASLDTMSTRMAKEDKNQPALQRAQRASSNMIQLSQSLLWMARQSNKTLPKTSISIATLCRQVAHDLNYLIEGKEIELQFVLTENSITIEEPLLHIVLANLIRNAYQYTEEGSILIVANEHSVSIYNQASEETSTSDSFGLGLELVEKICHKIGWKFNYSNQSLQTITTIQWY